MSAGHAPMPVSGMRKARSASDGIVCRSPAVASSGCVSRRTRAAAMPIGTPAATAAASEANTSVACSTARRPKSGANTADHRLRGAVSAFAPRNSPATAANATRSSSARPLRRIIVASSMRPCSPAQAAKACGWRFGRSWRCSTTAS